MYFLSTRPVDENQYPSGRDHLFYLDLRNGEIYPTDDEFRHILRSPASRILDFAVSGDMMALVEDYDLTRLYLIDLKKKVIIRQWEGTPPLSLVGLENGRIITQENGKRQAYSIATPSMCDMVYTSVDQYAEYNGGMNGLVEYFTQHLLPVLRECDGGERKLTTQMTIMLTIDAEGDVIDAQLLDHHLKEDCTALLKSELLTMTGWSPARHEGQPVCSRYGFETRSVKWN